MSGKEAIYLANGFEGVLSGNNTVIEPRRLFPVIVVCLENVPLRGGFDLPNVGGVHPVPADHCALARLDSGKDVVDVSNQCGVAEIVQGSSVIVPHGEHIATQKGHHGSILLFDGGNDLRGDRVNLWKLREGFKIRAS